jgi:hypothetical protein
MSRVAPNNKAILNYPHGLVKRVVATTRPFQKTASSKHRTCAPGLPRNEILRRQCCGKWVKAVGLRLEAVGCRLGKFLSSVFPKVYSLKPKA